MSPDPKPSAERLAIASLSVLVLSPIVQEGVSCPVSVALHVAPGGLAATGAALAVAGVVAVAYAVSSVNRWRPAAFASITAVLLGALLGARGGAAAVGAATVGLLAVAAFAGALLPRMVARLPLELDGLGRRRKVASALVLAVSLLSVVQTARVSTFIGDASRSELSLIPSVPFLVRHSCLTAYVEGARLAIRHDENLYDADNWPELSKSPRAEAAEAPYAPFSLDAYAYPPPFLLLPRVLLLPMTDFRSQRAVWFAFNALVLAVGLWTVAMWARGKGCVRAVVLIPVVWVSLPTLLILQIGNVHATIIVLAMLAMVAFESDRPALGGALLAFAILSKISPGLLIILLLVRRRFRDVAWTAAFGVGLVLVGVAMFGIAPWKAFVLYEMPRLSSGEALSFLAGDAGYPINMAPFGVPFKLAHFGVDVGDPWKSARVINTVFSLIIVALTAAAARKEGSPRARAMVWLTVLTLGTLRSPFAPSYVVVPLLWIFSLWAAELRGAKGVIAMALAWLFLANTPPLSLTVVAAITLVQQVVVVGILVYLALRRSPSEPSSAGDSSTPAVGAPTCSSS